MPRTIKFRAQKSTDHGGRGAFIEGFYTETHERPNRTETWIVDFEGNSHLVYADSLGQLTGLKDKNGVQEVYEGDIIDVYGTIKGNVYEMDKGETDLVIEGLGTSAWSKTEEAGLERGLKYTE